MRSSLFPYRAEPFFHTKVSVLSAADECHLLVGSGNLTFGGWGGNYEVLEHLHPAFAADAIRRLIRRAPGHRRIPAEFHIAEDASETTGSNRADGDKAIALRAGDGRNEVKITCAVRSRQPRSEV